VRRALERKRLAEDRQRSQRAPDPSDELVAQDPSMVAVVAQVDKVAVTDATVLLLGESGTGKELLAQRLHRRSRRSDGPFVAVNCAALSDTLLESEIFGHERGAFTGATATRRGRFELADGGTLFLDEIAELRPALQAKLLRVLQDYRFERVGGTRTIEVDVRVVAATNRNLEEAQAAGTLRSDLYHRLAVFPIRLPPLRERVGDILPLAKHLLGGIGRQLGRRDLSLEPAAEAALLAYSWPGNVRELANLLERAAILAEGSTLTASHLAIPAGVPTPTPLAALDGTLEDLEREAIRRALAAEGGHRKNAAARLGIGLRTLYEKLKAFGIE
jgi:two-component system response regulator FlrC